MDIYTRGALRNDVVYDGTVVVARIYKGGPCTHPSDTKEEIHWRIYIY